MKNNLGQTIPSILNTQYGRPANWKVHEYLSYTLSNPVTRPEWVAFLQNSPWFENRKHYLANAWARFTAYPKFNVATYGMYQTHGPIPFTINTDPWILNPLYASQTVERNPTTGQYQFHYAFIDDFRAIQNATVARESEETEAVTPGRWIGEQAKLGIYPNPAKNHLHVQGAKGEFLIRSAFGQPVREFAGEDVDLSDLAPGVYVIHHQQSGEKKVFMKE